MTLIRPETSGEALLREIADFAPAPGSLAVWWLGQSGYVIKSRTGTLVIDPYLSEHLTTKYANTNRPHVRMTEAPFRGHELGGIDLVLASHKHSDHLDPGTMPNLLEASPKAVLGLPAAIADHAVGQGLPADRLIPLEDGTTFEVAGFRVRAVPSAHEALDVDARGRPLYLGFVVECDGVRLYHSGDTVPYDALAGRLGGGPFDALFLPINGRDPARGVPGNMTAVEAAEFAARVGPRYVVPHHYDMFTFNTVPVADFEQAAAGRLPAGVVAKVLRCGGRWEIRPWA